MHGSPHALAGDLPAVAADVIARLRERAPRVHCITNTVAQAFTANILLAAGAIPSMTIAPQEIADFAARADALLVNLGTFDAERRAAIEIALEQATRAHAAMGARSGPDRRVAAARRLCSRACRAQARGDPAQCRGIRRACGRARERGGAGACRRENRQRDRTDRHDRSRQRRQAQPHHRKRPSADAAVTAMGCAASALVAACLCVEKDAFVATAAALLAFSVAGEIAAQAANGPGSFAVAFIDALHNLDRAALIERARVS